MRVSRVETTNVAGLVDGVLDLPDVQVTALAGANGTGKSKLLACILVPWTRVVPPARDPNSEVKVKVSVTFTSEEQTALDEYSRQHGWSHELPTPPLVEFCGWSKPLGGSGVSTGVNESTFMSFPTDTRLLKHQPSLNLVFLPAERRLLPANSAVVNLDLLSEDNAILKLTESRSSITNYGRLDDNEFENFATALCVQGSLPSEKGMGEESHPSRWEAFKSAVDELLYPKRLLPLTRENSSQLRIGLPDGGSHPVPDLSSGERQALIIVSRVFQAGEQQSFIIIDEPDAYLHPSLSTRLLKALRPGLGDQGKLLVATHSPAILDALSPSSIIRLSHTQQPRLVEGEAERIRMYREAGFRASGLTQAEILVMVEGEFDATVMPQLLPSINSSSLQVAGGRRQVLSHVKSLSKYDLPIIGIVDADVRPSQIPRAIQDRIFEWPAADIEGVLLQDDDFLTKALEGNLLNRSTCPDLESTKKVLQDLWTSKQSAAVAEYAQRILREKTTIKWSSPRGATPLDDLRRVAADGYTELTLDLINDAICEGEEEWSRNCCRPWKMVRGKYIINDFVSAHTVITDSEKFIAAVLARQPEIAAVNELRELIDSLTLPNYSG